MPSNLMITGPMAGQYQPFTRPLLPLSAIALAILLSGCNGDEISAQSCTDAADPNVLDCRSNTGDTGTTTNDDLSVGVDPPARDCLHDVFIAMPVECMTRVVGAYTHMHPVSVRDMAQDRPLTLRTVLATKKHCKFSSSHFTSSSLKIDLIMSIAIERL